MPGVTLRPGAPRDFEALYRIDQACFPRGVAYSRSVLRHYLGLAGAVCLVAEEDEGIAGFIVGASSGAEGHIITLDVLEPCRRRGIGSALLAALESRLAARGVEHIGLETATSGQTAVAFWRKHGYVACGTAKDYYGRGRDALLMRKRLTPLELT